MTCLKVCTGEMWIPVQMPSAGPPLAAARVCCPDQRASPTTSAQANRGTDSETGRSPRPSPRNHGCRLNTLFPYTFRGRVKSTVGGGVGSEHRLFGSFKRRLREPQRELRGTRLWSAILSQACLTKRFYCMHRVLSKRTARLFSAG